MAANREMHTALVGLLGLGLALLACKGKDESPPAPANPQVPAAAEQPQPQVPAQPVAQAQPQPQAPAQPQAAPQPAAPAPPQIPTISRFQVGEGEASNGVWTPGFAAQRNGGDQSKNFVEAAQSCSSQGLSLCTETQYIKACAANPAVGTYSSWTASWANGTSVVTRGGGGCDSRAETIASERSDSRMALCCERAIGIRTGNKNSAFMKVSHADQLGFEQAFNSKSAANLSKYWAEWLIFDGAQMGRDKVNASQSSWFSSHPVQWTLYDVCDVKLGQVQMGNRMYDGLVSDCRTVTAVNNSDVSVFTTHFGRYRFPEGKRNEIVEISHKDRIRKLTPL
ncbi:MAG: hypothetical protein H6718_27445 [Polyangiaceae bacterium]|nr:hypothetical protein [Myxococcales bacterium]MCB9589179.1 hypothetical protein [Polyangiaceae bacterium]